MKCKFCNGPVRVAKWTRFDITWECKHCQCKWHMDIDEYQEGTHTFLDNLIFVGVVATPHGTPKTASEPDLFAGKGA